LPNSCRAAAGEYGRMSWRNVLVATFRLPNLTLSLERSPFADDRSDAAAIVRDLRGNVRP
jgi:hypothetical protein